RQRKRDAEKAQQPSRRGHSPMLDPKEGNNIVDTCRQGIQNTPACPSGRLWSLLDIMRIYDISMVAYVMHEIDVAQDTANLAQLLGGREPEQTLLDQSNKAIRLADTLFTKFPIGKCLEHVQSAKVPLARPMLTVDIIGVTFNRLKGDIIGELHNQPFLKVSPAQADN